MALSIENQQAVELQEAMEATRTAAQDADRTRNTKLEALRMAQLVLIENRRVRSAADTSDITTSDITSFADAITAYVEAP
tara:strand:- start:4245 stop:4484 length:240 start_codon:yes stop_codon:yes gene_type:complete